VGVEVHQRGRAEPLPGHPQQRVGDRVVTADGEQPARAVEQARRGRFDLAHGLGDVERVAGDVTRVGDLLSGDRGYLEGRMPGAEQPGSLAHRAGAEPGARPVGRAAVERHPRDDHVAVADLVPPGQQRERRGAGVARDLARVDRPAYRRTGCFGVFRHAASPA